MARDYKPAARRRTPQPSGSGSSLLVGMVIGLLLGLGIALGVAIYLNRVPDFVSRGKQAEPVPSTKQESGKLVTKAKAEDPAAAKSAEKPRFDFYSILPSTDEGKDKSQGKQGNDATRGLPEVKETFYVQAGAFQSAADADNLKARLAMLGVEAAVQSGVTMDRGQLHRVRVGPFTRVEEVNRVRETLKQNGIETTLIKGREAPR